VDPGGINNLSSKTEKEQLSSTSSVCLMRLDDMRLGEDGERAARYLSPADAAVLVGMTEAQLLKHTWVSVVCAKAPC